jgi:hypothetical protein
MNNCCDSYVETVFFQYDLFPVTDVIIDYKVPTNCTIKKVIYFLDSSMGDDVRVTLNYINRSGLVQPLLLTPPTSNAHIRGTFNTQNLEFNTNIKMNRSDKIQLIANNASASDVTIMCLVDLLFNARGAN